MQSLQLAEIAALSHRIESYENCRLQRIESGSDWVAFLFYGQGQEKSLFLSLNPKCPLLLPVAPPPSLKRKTIPALLFLKAHFANHILRKVSHDPNEGRVLRLHFSGSAREIEFRLFPHGQNMIARVEDKKISAFKVSELQGQAPSQPSQNSGRTVDELVAEFLAQFEKKPAALENIQEQIEKQLQKKVRALELVEKDIFEKESAPFRELGEWLKMNQSLNVPDKFLIFVDRKKSFAENLNAVFQKAKQVNEKLKSARARRLELLNEIRKLKAGEWKAPAQTSALKKANAKGRTIELSSGQLLYLGKSAEENIKLLRASQPWDYWLHVKDFPGSHGIIRRNKQEKIPDAIFIEALQHLLAKQFGAKAKNHFGEKFACLIVESRYVKPIKGDRIGRVTYQNERVLTLQFKS